MATKSQSIRHLTTGMTIYDEERLESGSVSTSICGRRRLKRWLQFLRLRKGAAFLLLVNLIITSASQAIPNKWVRSQHSCKEAYVGFEYKLWTDELSRNFLASEYPWFLDRWNNYALPIQRADSIRYFILHHYGGIYLDMDTFCNATFPLDQVKSYTPLHTAVFKSTVPTGDITRPWARLQPYCNIMIAAGPFFITWVVKDYLLQQPSMPSATIQVVNSAQLTPYITDLESSSWHQADAPALMWLGQRPWAWFGLTVVGLVSGLYVSNQVLLMVYGAFLHKVPYAMYQIKQAKVT
ncbi:glycosyltransferase family 32 protein [Oidiodendron maius Zn]|uniref:Glycosyltransferase family 32 protein n=1 Tax=Oidiodendron maius (strain Zn) TaxID=913774 RepID=A0A0C3C9S0_OIDMZ|nr:glycosyltransferase family 32 protein [Oidiodendron maius Zn]